MAVRKALYSIGEVSNFCQVSRKTLRYYEQLGLLLPDEIKENGYRYYSYQKLLQIPIIKYFKQMGFQLDDIKQIMQGETFHLLTHYFQDKIQDLDDMEKEIKNKKAALKDWVDMIKEAQFVLAHQMKEVSIKFCEEKDYCTLPYDFNFDYREAILNVDYTNYVESIGNAITGPVMLYFPSAQKKAEQISQQVEIIQKPIHNLKNEEKKIIPAGFYASVYHIGSHDNLSESYHEIEAWCQKQGYQLGAYSIERYLVDYWISEDEENFVTEILIPVEKNKVE